jgi:hypothetical protein
LQANEARRGTVVRVREGHWKRQFAGMTGTVQNSAGEILNMRLWTLYWKTGIRSCSGLPTCLW